MKKPSNLTFSNEKALSIFGIICLISILFSVISHELLLFKSMPMNGAFQLFNPLKRLADGQLVGKDFDFFHGPGCLLSHYPLFAIMGGDLWASEISRKVMSFAAYIACFYICAKAWRIPAYFASLGACSVFVVGEAAFLGSGAQSGSSMVGLRSTLPAIALPIALIICKRYDWLNRPGIFHTILGTALGISMFIATEQGLAAIAVSFLILTLIPIVNRNTLTRMAWPTWMIFMAISTYLVAAMIASGGHTSQIITYAFKDLPKDQFWYFGSPPNLIPKLPEVFWNPKILVGVWMPLTLLLVEIHHTKTFRKRNSKIPFSSLIVFALLIHALVVQIPQLASYSHYQSVSTRNVGLVAMLWAYRCISNYPLEGQSLLMQFSNKRLPLSVIVSVLISTLTLFILGNAYLAKKRSTETSGVRYAGMALSKGWASDLAVWKSLAATNSSVAGTYRALIDDQQRSDFDGPDYIIHALGSRRPQFLNSFKAGSPDFFLTLNPEFSEYEEWLQLRHWDVYRHLISFYYPSDSSDFHVFWKKRGKDAITTNESGEQILKASQVDDHIWRTPPNNGVARLFTARVRYSVNSPFTKIPVLGNLPRYILTRTTIDESNVTSHIPVSLPPYEGGWEFPIILKNGEQAEFALDILMRLPRIHARVDSIELYSLTSDGDIIKSLSNK